MADAPAVRMTLREAYVGLATKVAPLLPDGMEPKQFVGLVGSAMNKWKEQDRAQVDPDSFIFAVREAAELQLWPGTNPAALGYLIPKREKGVLKCQFRLGYRGLEELAYRKGWILTGAVVYKGDVFRWSLGTHPEVYHRPRRSQPATGAELIYAYAVCKDIRTQQLIDVEVLDREAIERRRHLGDAPNETWWVKHRARMSLKSAVRSLGMRLPLAPSGQTLRERGIDVVADEPRWTAPDLPELSDGQDGLSGAASGAESREPADPPDDDQPPADEEQNGDAQEPKQERLV